jgi:hypothetical protein
LYVVPFVLDIDNVFLLIFSPNTVLGMAKKLTLALLCVGKDLISASILPDAAVDCREESHALPVPNKDPLM